ncbi:MAG: hypothetical protein ACRBBP_03550 [Bdellovibrionales bacterium]
MEIKNSFVILLCSLFIVSCAQIPKVNFRNTEPQREVPAESESGEEVEEPEDETVTFETKKTDKLFRPKVTLVLGPGASRSFAHIGVLKELKASGIQVHSIIGMGWSSIVAAEYIDQKSVHGLEWKASRSEGLKKLSETSFWSASIKEKNLSDAENLIKGLLTNYSSRAANRGEFSCPLLSKRKGALIFSDKRGLKNCISVPPLFNPGKVYAPYLFDGIAIKQGALKMGAEKVIFIDVLNKNQKFFGSKEASVTGAVYWYWNFVAQITKSAHIAYDKVIEVPANSDILNFNNTLDSVRKGQQAGQELVEFLQREYQY